MKITKKEKNPWNVIGNAIITFFQLIIVIPLLLWAWGFFLENVIDKL